MRGKETLAMVTNVLIIGMVSAALLRPTGPVGSVIVRQYNDIVRRKIIAREWPEIASVRRVNTNRNPVGIVEFADYECPACRRQHSLYQATLNAPRAVGVAFRHRPLSSHTNAEGAARTAICAERVGKFVEMHTRLFTTDQWLADTNWTREALAVGITDTTAFNACRVSQETTERFRLDTLIARRLRINSTPTFVGEKFVRVGVMPDSMFIQRSPVGAP